MLKRLFPIALLLVAFVAVAVAQPVQHNANGIPTLRVSKGDTPPTYRDFTAFFVIDENGWCNVRFKNESGTDIGCPVILKGSDSDGRMQVHLNTVSSTYWIVDSNGKPEQP